MYDLYAHPNSYSSWVLQILLKELDVGYTLHDVDLFVGEQFKMEFLAVNPLGTVPVLVTADGHKEIGIVDIRKYLMDKHGDKQIFRGCSETYLSKLDEAPIGFITYGLAFNQECSKRLRYPFHEPDFFEKSRKYILERGSRLQDAINSCPDPLIIEALIQTTENHYSNAEQYLDQGKYSSALSAVSSMLDYFESDLGKDTKLGIWLGGIHPNVADIFLGMGLHRLWQLGMENSLFKEGVRPHLTLFYERIRERPSFKIITKWNTETSENIIKSDEDVFAENAKWSLGIMAALGGLYLGKKFLKK